MKKLIDISYAQSRIDWNKVKTQIEGVIIRCGFRSYVAGKCTEDARLADHYVGAHKAGLKIGLYFFSEAITEEEGREEAQFTLKLVKAYGMKLDFPIAIDTENIEDNRARANRGKLSKAKRTAIMKAFCEEILKAGYEPMIYASTSWLNDELDMSKLPYKVWVAQYASKCQYKGKKYMWQYTDKGKIDGIDGNVDMDYLYEEEKKQMSMVKWSGNLTKHFTLAEYTVGNGNTTLTITERAYHFAECLEEFRVWLKRPMTVTSWRRSVALNKAVGGIATSNHLTGTACDWHTNIAIDDKRFIKYAKKWKKIAQAHGFVGEAGLYNWGIHFGIQNEAQAKANGNKFVNWDSRSGKQKTGAFKI